MCCFAFENSEQGRGLIYYFDRSDRLTSFYFGWKRSSGSDLTLRLIRPWNDLDKEKLIKHSKQFILWYTISCFIFHSENNRDTHTHMFSSSLKTFDFQTRVHTKTASRLSSHPGWASISKIRLPAQKAICGTTVAVFVFFACFGFTGPMSMLYAPPLRFLIIARVCRISNIFSNK